MPADIYREKGLSYTRDEVLEELTRAGWGPDSSYGYRPGSVRPKAMRFQAAPEEWKELKQEEPVVEFHDVEQPVVEELPPPPPPPPVQMEEGELYHRMQDQEWLKNVPGERVVSQRKGEARVLETRVLDEEMKYTAKKYVHTVKYVEKPQIITKERIKKVPKYEVVERIIEVPKGGGKGGFGQEKEIKGWGQGRAIEDEGFFRSQGNVGWGSRTHGQQVHPHARARTYGGPAEWGSLCGVLCGTQFGGGAGSTGYDAYGESMDMDGPGMMARVFGADIISEEGRERREAFSLFAGGEIGEATAADYGNRGGRGLAFKHGLAQGVGARRRGGKTKSEEQVIEVPQVVTEGKVKQVPVIERWERLIEIPRVEFREVVQYEDRIEYREVPVDRIVEVPEIEYSIIEKDVPMSQAYKEEVLQDQMMEVPIFENQELERFENGAATSMQRPPATAPEITYQQARSGYAQYAQYTPMSKSFDPFRMPPPTDAFFKSSFPPGSFRPGVNPFYSMEGSQMHMPQVAG